MDKATQNADHNEKYSQKQLSGIRLVVKSRTANPGTKLYQVPNCTMYQIVPGTFMVQKRFLLLAFGHMAVYLAEVPVLAKNNITVKQPALCRRLQTVKDNLLA